MGSLSDFQQQLIIGCILGDGYMRKKTNAHLQITHSYKQKEYVDWKYEMLKNIILTPPKFYKGNKGRVGYRFFTRSLPQLTTLYDSFYRNGRKFIPKYLNLSPIITAVWYMDDGSRNHNTGYLNTQKFDIQSQLNLMAAFQKIGIISSLNKDKIYKRIRIATGSIPIFLKMVQPFIHKSMLYKLPI